MSNGKFVASVGNVKVAIPSKVEVAFLIDNSEDFVEQTLLALYRRHVENKGQSNGKGFNYATVKSGTRLGSWLAKNGHFTSGTGQWAKSREQHLATAREILKKHLDQILTMMLEKAAAAAPKVHPKVKAESLSPEVQAIVRERTAEIVALMNDATADAYEDEEEPITVRDPRFHPKPKADGSIEYVVI